MGGELTLISKSTNIDITMESDIKNIMKDAFINKKDCDFIAARCQESFGGSWIMIQHQNSAQGIFDMSFAFKSLKWIKFKRGINHYYLFQISE